MPQEIVNIIDRGLAAQKKTIDGIFEFAQCVADLKSVCQTISGGSEFSNLASSQWGISKATSSKWLAINQNHQLFHTVKQLLLPNTFSSLYELTTLSENEFGSAVKIGVVNNQCTRKEIIAYKQRLKAEKIDQKRKQELFEIEKYNKLSKKLYNELMCLLNTKPISLDDKAALIRVTSAENISKIGPVKAAEQLHVLFNKAQEYIEPKKKKAAQKQKKENHEQAAGPTLESSYALIYGEGWRERMFGDIVKFLPTKQETQGGILISVLINGGELLQKKVFKLMSQHLHPDKTTGNEKLFKQLQTIKEFFNE